MREAVTDRNSVSVAIQRQTVHQSTINSRSKGAWIDEEIGLSLPRGPQPSIALCQPRQDRVDLPRQDLGHAPDCRLDIDGTDRKHSFGQCKSGPKTGRQIIGVDQFDARRISQILKTKEMDVPCDASVGEVYDARLHRRARSECFECLPTRLKIAKNSFSKIVRQNNKQDVAIAEVENDWIASVFPNHLRNCGKKSGIVMMRHDELVR